MNNLNPCFLFFFSKVLFFPLRYAHHISRAILFISSAISREDNLGEYLFKNEKKTTFFIFFEKVFEMYLIVSTWF